MSDYTDAVEEVVDRVLHVVGKSLPHISRGDLDAIILDKVDSLGLRYHCAGGSGESVATSLRTRLPVLRARARHEWAETMRAS